MTTNLRFRVVADVETRYIAEVDAPSAADAVVIVGDMIRAGQLEPLVGPAIAHTEVSRKRPPPAP